jgi:hypothetical protein
MEGGKEAIVLVIECQNHLDWRKTFGESFLEDGTRVRVEQASWDDISVVSWPLPTGLRVSCLIAMLLF